MSINNEIENKFYEENKDISDSYYLIFIEYTPYVSDIKISIDRDEVKKNSKLNPCGRAFEKWIERLPSILSEKYGNDANFKVGFHGADFDFNKIRGAFENSELNIEWCYYPIKTFNNKLNIIKQIFKEIDREKDSFCGSFYSLFNNFSRNWKNKEIDKYNLITSLSHDLKNIVKYYREEFQKEEYKKDNDISAINKNIENLKEQLKNKQNSKNDILKEIEEFQENIFPKKVEEIKNRYLVEFKTQERKKQLVRFILKVRGEEDSLRSTIGLLSFSKDFDIKDSYKSKYDIAKKYCTAIKLNNTSICFKDKCIFKECYIEFYRQKSCGERAKSPEEKTIFERKNGHFYIYNDIYNKDRMIAIIEAVYNEFTNSNKDHNSFFNIVTFLDEFRKEINSLVEEKLKKWKENFSYNLFATQNEDNLCLGWLWKFFNDLLSLNIIVKSFKSSELSSASDYGKILRIERKWLNIFLEINFSEIKKPFENFFSDVVTKEKEDIEKLKQEIEGKFFDVYSQIEKDIESEEEKINSLEAKKQNIQSRIELLQRIEQQSDSLIEI